MTDNVFIAQFSHKKPESSDNFGDFQAPLFYGPCGKFESFQRSEKYEAVLKEAIKFSLGEDAPKMYVWWKRYIVRNGGHIDYRGWVENPADGEFFELIT